QMAKVTRGPKKAVLSDLVDVARIAATQDARGLFLGPKMLRLASAGPASLDQAIGIVRKWIKAGAHRINRNWDGDMNDDGEPDSDEMEDNGPAAVIFDTWYELLVQAVFEDELGPEGLELVPTELSDRDQWHDFSSFLQNVFNRRASKALARNYCDNIGTTDTKESCGSLAISTLEATVEAIKSDQGEDMSAWTTDAWFNVFEGLGLGSVRKMAWQNRGTHNHIVEILRRANDGPTGGGGSVRPSPLPSG
ncbi:MAG TPA: penicillin acylase family protein, partial [Actinomycetota bacterium]|nr:penicillin acylase family protein [Actinomycetota bacterium]